MSDLATFIAARDALNVIIAAGGGTAITGTPDNHLTDPLDETGVWRPKALEVFNARVLAKYPDQYLPVGDIGPGGVPRRAAIGLFDGFYVPDCINRDDLTDVQRAKIAEMNNWTFFAAMPGDVTQRLYGIPADTTALPPDGVPGRFVLALHRKHTDLSDLPRLLANTYARFGVIV